MFESLDEHMKHDDALEKTQAERIAEAALIAILSVLLFSGLYFAVHMLQG